MSFAQGLLAAAAASSIMIVVKLLSNVLDPFVALVAATKPASRVTVWCLGRAVKAAGLASVTVLLVTPLVGGREALFGAAVGAPLGVLAGIVFGRLLGELFRVIRRLPHRRSNSVLHSVSMAARWPRGRRARPPSRGTWRARPFGAHLRLAVLHRLRSPLLPLRAVAGLLGVPAIVGLHSSLVGRGWDHSTAVVVPAYLAAALNLADADVSPVANLGARSALSLHTPTGRHRLVGSSALATLVPVLGPIVPLLAALAIVSGLSAPILFVMGALALASALLAYGSAQILDVTEEIPAPLDPFIDMVPMNGARAVNLGLAQLALAGMVWLLTL